MIAWIESHPLYTGIGAVVLFIIAYLAFSGGSSGSSSAGYVPVNAGPSDAVQEASIAASLQQTQTQAAAQAQADQTQAQYNLGVLQLQQNGQSTLVAAQVQDLQTSDSTDIAMQQLQGQTSIANTAANDQVAIATLADQTSAQLNSQNQATQQLQISTAGQSAAEQLQAETSMYNTGAALQSSLASTAASVINNQTQATSNDTLAQIDAQSSANQLTAALESQGLDTEQTLGLASISSDTTIAGYTANNQSTAILAQAGYLQNLVNLVGLGKNISGLPGVGTTTQNVNAAASAAPGNTTGGIIASIGSLIGKIGQGLSTP